MIEELDSKAIFMTGGLVKSDIREKEVEARFFLYMI